jgi:hypothetical protein
MAHFAQLDENNIVVQVITAGDEYEANGEELYAQINGGVWKKTSYNTVANQHQNGGTPYRGNYASIGGKYDEKLDIFIPKKPFLSWVFNTETASWEAPIPKPTDGNVYMWDEPAGVWVDGGKPNPNRLTEEEGLALWAKLKEEGLV